MCVVLLCLSFPDALIQFRLESSSYPVVTAHRKNGGIVQVFLNHTNYHLLLISCSVGQNMKTFPLVLVTVLLYVVRSLLRWVRANSNSLITFAPSCSCWGQMIFTAWNPGASFSGTAFVLELLPLPLLFSLHLLLPVRWFCLHRQVAFIQHNGKSSYVKMSLGGSDPMQHFVWILLILR